nr:tyrosine-type recombinase/integrase [Microbacterium paulum]
MSRLLDGAVRARLVPLNQARLARRPKSESATSLRSRALTAAEVPILLAAIDDAHYRRYIAALVYTGMRANEATALRMEDVDLAHRTIHVRRAFSIGADGRGVELTPKSHKERDVPIPMPLVAPLLEAMTGKHRGDLVFTGPRGGGSAHRTCVARSIGRRSARSCAATTCDSTTCATRSPRCCSMPVPPPTTSRPYSGTRACR